MCVVNGENILVSFHLYIHGSKGLSMSYLLLSKQIRNQNANVCMLWVLLVYCLSAEY